MPGKIVDFEIVESVSCSVHETKGVRLRTQRLTALHCATEFFQHRSFRAARTRFSIAEPERVSAARGDLMGARLHFGWQAAASFALPVPPVSWRPLSWW